MIRRAAALTLLLCLPSVAGCGAGEKTEERAAAVPTPRPSPTPEVRINYTQGFFNLERGADGSTWRWMDEAGVVKLRTTKSDMLLKISGRAPVERFTKPATIKIQFNGEPLDQLPATPQGIDKEFAIPAAKQGNGEWADLRISIDRSFVPKDAVKGATDARRLGFQLTKLTWEPPR